jgi:toxin-antitoxin system PIN domain toxin
LIAVDSNVLICAHRSEMPLHEAAAATISELATSPAQWAIPWPCVQEFYGTVTNRRAFRPPSSIAVALEQIDAWLESPSLVLLAETTDHRSVLGALLRDAQILGPTVHDARIAAICLSHGVTELLTMDRDFAKFAPLRTRSLVA